MSRVRNARLTSPIAILREIRARIKIIDESVKLRPHNLPERVALQTGQRMLEVLAQDIERDNQVRSSDQTDGEPG